jgi:hypothetical protein
MRLHAQAEVCLELSLLHVKQRHLQRQEQTEKKHQQD